jgi:uncharacterized protein involved in response to NO
MAKRAQAADFGAEPFRIFFPAGVLAGLVGVALWPLYFGQLISFYPGQAHVRLMAFGFFGAFIFGFLGTAMPRMLSAQKLGLPLVSTLLAAYAISVASYSFGKLPAGDLAFLVLLLVFASAMAPRFLARQDTPPPGFALVALAWACVGLGTILAVWQNYREMDTFWVQLQRLLTSQGFVLLPILGIGPFILPRFFGLQSPHDFPEFRNPPPSWKRKAWLALGTGLTIIGSFVLEANGEHRFAYALRFGATMFYLVLEFPFRAAPKVRTALGASLHLAFASLAIGFLLVTLFPDYRTGWLHLTLIGGFAVVTFVVATRVVFGHSGNLEKLKKGNAWLMVAVSMMLLGMATRISGDFWPKIMASHYNYGALLWAGGVLIWSVRVLPKVLQAEDE